MLIDYFNNIYHSTNPGKLWELLIGIYRTTNTSFTPSTTILNLTEFWGCNFYELILDHCCTYNYQCHIQRIYHAYYLILGHQSLQKTTVRICLTYTNSELKVELWSLRFVVGGKNYLRKCL